jgi:peptidoglycan/xylan/chitin deacetylase (PgdA/CDA1 family)
VIERWIAVFGNASDVFAALQVFKRVQQKLAVSRIVVIARDSTVLRTAIRSSSHDVEITVQDLDNFTFDLVSPLYLFVNLSPGAGFPVFEAALRAIPVISARSSYMPPIFVPDQSGYLFSYQDLNALEQILCHIATAPEEVSGFAREAQKRLIAWCGRSYLSREYEGPLDGNGISQARSLAKATLFASVPRRYLIANGNSRLPQFALTFDDGPDPATTRAVLATLRKHGVRATFFLVGNRAQQYPDLAKEIVEEGHEIGSHSYSHPYFDRLSLAQAAREIAVAKTVLEDVTGQECRLFRPPFGKLSAQSLLPAWLHKQRVVLWTVDLKDYRATEAAEIKNKATAQRLVNGDIILYHGLNLASIEALPAVIQAAKAQGRMGVPVSSLV